MENFEKRTKLYIIARNRGIIMTKKTKNKKGITPKPQYDEATLARLHKELEEAVRMTIGAKGDIIKVTDENGTPKIVTATYVAFLLRIKHFNGEFDREHKKMYPFVDVEFDSAPFGYTRGELQLEVPVLRSYYYQGYYDDLEKDHNCLSEQKFLEYWGAPFEKLSEAEIQEEIQSIEEDGRIYDPEITFVPHGPYYPSIPDDGQDMSEAEWEHYQTINTHGFFEFYAHLAPSAIEKEIRNVVLIFDTLSRNQFAKEARTRLNAYLRKKISKEDFTIYYLTPWEKYITQLCKEWGCKGKIEYNPKTKSASIYVKRKDGFRLNATLDEIAFGLDSYFIEDAYSSFFSRLNEAKMLAKEVKRLEHADDAKEWLSEDYEPLSYYDPAAVVKPELTLTEWLESDYDEDDKNEDLYAWIEEVKERETKLRTSKWRATQYVDYSIETDGTPRSNTNYGVKKDSWRPELTDQDGNLIARVSIDETVLQQIEPFKNHLKQLTADDVDYISYLYYKWYNHLHELKKRIKYESQRLDFKQICARGDEGLKDYYNYYGIITLTQAAEFCKKWVTVGCPTEKNYAELSPKQKQTFPEFEFILFMRNRAVSKTGRLRKSNDRTVESSNGYKCYYKFVPYFNLSLAEVQWQAYQEICQKIEKTIPDAIIQYNKNLLKRFA